MKTLKVLTACIVLLIAVSCSNDDNPAPVDPTNTFKATFNGQTIEPYLVQSGGVRGYTLNVTRNSQNEEDWNVYVSDKSQIGLELWLLDVTGVGTYDINTGSLDYLTLGYHNNAIYFQDEITNKFTYASLGNTGSYTITEYDANKGIIVGTFKCDMYNTSNPGDIRLVEGEFNINLETINDI